MISCWVSSLVVFLLNLCPESKMRNLIHFYHILSIKFCGCTRPWQIKFSVMYVHVLTRVLHYLFVNLLSYYNILHKLNKKFLDPFHATDLFWYPLKTSENQRFSDVFRGYQKRSMTWNGLIAFLVNPIILAVKSFRWL